MSVHFWVPQKDHVDLSNWNPDKEPKLYSNTIGHAIFELYARCRIAGKKVTIGPKIPKEATLICALLGTFQSSKIQAAILMSRIRRRPLLIIRSGESINPKCRYLFPSLTVVPRLIMQSKSAVYLPPLPQRELIPRRQQRFGSVSSVAWKGYPSGIPSLLRDEIFLQQLELNNFDLDIDHPSISEGSNHSWNDFSEADVVLCLRNDIRGDADYTKPPTKLINAWVAGCIPIVAQEGSSVDLVTDGVDGFVEEDPTRIIELLLRLRDRDFNLRIQKSIERKRRMHSPDVIFRLWLNVLESLEGTKPPIHTTLARIAALPIVFLNGITTAVKYRILNWTEG